MTLTPKEAAQTAFEMACDYFAELYEGDTPIECWHALRELITKPDGGTVWTYQGQMEELPYDEITQFICDETGDSCNEGENVALQLVRAYDRATLDGRDAIDNATIAITGWSVKSLVEKTLSFKEEE